MSFRIKGVQAVAVLTLAIPATRGYAEESWGGLEVMPKLNCQPESEGKVLPWKSITLPMRVCDERDNRLCIGRGWVKKTDVIPAGQSLEYYSSLIRSGPPLDQLARLYQLRSSTYAWTGRLQEAAADATKGIEIAPAAATYCARGMIYTLQRHFPESESDFEHALRLEPDFAAAHFGRGRALMNSRRWNEAIVAFSRAIELDKGFSPAYAARGVAAFANGKSLEAMSDFNEAIRIDPSDFFAHLCRAGLRESGGDFAGAISDYSVAVKVNSRASSGYRGLARIRATCPVAHHRDGKSALADATKACEIEGWQTAESIEVLAAAYAECGDFSRAVAMQERATDAAPPVARSRYQLRTAQYKSGLPYRSETVRRPPAGKTGIPGKDPATLE